MQIPAAQAVLGELSGKDTAAMDPMDALVERTLTASHNYFIEIYQIRSDGSLGNPIFRTQNLGSDTVKNYYSLERISPSDTARALGETEVRDETLRAAIA